MIERMARNILGSFMLTLMVWLFSWVLFAAIVQTANILLGVELAKVLSGIMLGLFHSKYLLPMFFLIAAITLTRYDPITPSTV